MRTLKSKTIIYDETCPLCDAYTGSFVKAGALGKDGRTTFSDVDNATLTKLDINRARHEIPLMDNATGEVLYGLDGLMLLMSEMFPFLKPIITKTWFKKMISPVYKFISYNRRVIAGSFYGGVGFDCAPDFSLKWRLALIAFGMSFIAGGIYSFSVIAGVSNVFMVFVVVFIYFLIMLAADLAFNKTFEERIDYLGHLVTLGIMESVLFVATALIAKFLNLPALLFAGQGAGRLFATYLHAKRVENNHYGFKLNYAFAFGAVGLIVYLAYILR